ncbi:DUF167 domain-containing protein [Sinimarinibacterium sp. NLF-5-8]|uniref:DUF167 domain-containing protein n=1 Tax=Sinimarinibacterium sp. NLF-5-8 TaxID=2698684 RepID=UPI00137BEE48|nr:DUF167 domain-containing protein [Sinimarinibacterium sp. NLF-5-8]QHS10836.1 DUF167 domain-containing protein [Sinimarinibacterium sp. NLF-5-8]
MSQCLINLKVSPKASRTAVTGWMGDVLKVSVTTAPERGKANDAVIALLAKVLKLPKSSIHVVSGHSNPNKRVQIDGLDQAQLRQRLG